MRNTSSIRRVDDLGRVVIPKEIREKLHIKTGSVVYVENIGNEIVITNYNKIDNYLNLIQLCVNGFDNFSDLFVCVCNSEKIIAKNKNIVINNIDNLFNYLSDRKIQMLYYDKVIKISEESYKSQGIFPIVIDGELLGGLIVMSKKYINNFDFVLPIYNILQNIFE